MSDQAPERDDATLAAEYVIGLLSSEERADVERRLRSDTALAGHVAFWETHLAELNANYGEEAPPPSVKAAVDTRLFPAEAKPRRWGLFGSLSRGPGLGLGLGALAAILIGIFVAFAPEEPGFEAVLQADDSPFRFEIRANAEIDALDVTLASGSLEAGQVFELWTIPEGGAPISLGVFEPGGRVAVGSDIPLADGALLAVSLEPIGGSPTGQPTGPVVALGTLGMDARG